MTAPAGALSIFPHCRSSDCSRRSSIYISPLPQQYLLPQEPFLYSSTAAAVTAPAGAFSVFPHCRSSVCSRRSAICISPLLQQCLLPQERYLYFPTAAAVTAPAGALCISLLPQQCLLPQEPFLYSSTATAVTAPTGALSVFPHCRSSDCSCRSPICISLSSLLFRYRSSVRSCRSLYLTHSHRRSGVRSRRSLLCISTLPQQYLLLQKPLFSFQMPQQCRYYKRCPASRQP